MSLSTIFNSVDKYVKLKPWLQFVGYMLMAGGYVAHSSHHALFHAYAADIAFLGFGISMAGFCYELIYP
jgi:hypothetical protein